MHALSALDVLDAWDRARGLHAVDAALAILGVACSGQSRDTLAALSVGERDRLLLECRARTFGPQLELYAECSACAQRLEVAIDVRELVRATPAGGSQPLAAGGLDLRVRAPDSFDLASAVRLADGDARRAARFVAERCVVQAHRGGEPVAPQDLPDEVVRAISQRVAALDPVADIEIAMACPRCGHCDALTLDIVSLLREEIDVHARRLAREVHVLATAYGWSADAVLAMSPSRRALFLELAQG